MLLNTGQGTVLQSIKELAPFIKLFALVLERFIIGVSVQTAIFGLASYYAGLMGWHVAMHGLVLPLVSIAVGVTLWWKRK